MIDATVLIESGIKAVAPKLVESVINSFKNINFKGSERVLLNEHMEQAFQRCTQIKTIVNGDKPISLFDAYVSPDLACGEDSFDEYSFIEYINKHSKIILLGTAGAGKSMLMRYLWVCYTVNPEGKIPLFVELRKFDSSNMNSFFNYLLYSVVDSPSVEKEKPFRALLDSDGFSLILDGFDELTEQSKEEVGRFLLDLGKSNNRIVVSSRHSDVFRSWQHFHLFTIVDFTIAKSVEVVRKIDYDNSVKSKFIARLKKDLYRKHKSFASRPLLLSMMLLTFRYYADVPDKMHLFYEQAFETLATRHDIGKEMFKREAKTTYSSDLFKRYFSMFCLISYNDGEFEFSTADLFEVMKKVEKIVNADIEKQAFLSDLLDWVCVLQRDGLDIVFTHRSFQEYFACLCLLSLPDYQVGDFLRKFSLRMGDNVST